MVADAISERGDAMALVQVAVPGAPAACPARGPAEHPAEHLAGARWWGAALSHLRGDRCPQTRGNIIGSLQTVNSPVPIGRLYHLTAFALFPLCYIRNLHKRSSVNMPLVFASALRVALYLSAGCRKRSRDAKSDGPRCLCEMLGNRLPEKPPLNSTLPSLKLY